jgi:hypothetical protein
LTLAALVELKYFPGGGLVSTSDDRPMGSAPHSVKPAFRL